ncbi:putative phenylalanine--tRNA ligase [Rosa chinensis]|uniref:Putative phenylalanine--tRNA ligase n=1 Tax=Rosa chinensis TaxID=74649 RepID=A0A2P6RF83_ROSCH|nr:putative phenylalanine--tRNA ligase [Rosa chinensis]
MGKVVGGFGLRSNRTRNIEEKWENRMLLGLSDLDWSGWQWFYLTSLIFAFSGQLMTSLTWALRGSWESSSSHIQSILRVTKMLVFGSSESFTENNLCEVVREVAGDLAKEVQLIDNFTNKKGMTSHCYRIAYIGLRNDHLQTRKSINCRVL